MKLVLVTKGFWEDVGEVNAAREVTTELVKLGVELIAVVHPDWYVKCRRQTVPIETLQRTIVKRGLLSEPILSRYYLSARVAKTLKLIDRDLGADCVIHCHNLYPSAFSTTRFVETKAKLFTTIHGMIDDEAERFSREMLVHPRDLIYRLGIVGSFYSSHFLVRHTKGQIITLSPRNAYQVARLGLQESRIHTLPNGVDLNFYREYDKIESRKRLGLPLDKSIVLTINAIGPRKGLHLLIKAAHAITESVPDAHFVVVGKVLPHNQWYAGYLQKLLRESDLRKHFSFTGFVPKNDLPLFLSAADLFTLPSYCEGAPLVIPSAMACGRVVVATESAAAGYLPTNLVVENGNYKALAERISYYLSNEKQCRQFGQNLQKKAVTELSWRRIAERTLALYRNAVTDDSP